jgi:serine/threonine protein kinase/tetratricopeptide (TPR) repeat protein
VAVPQHVEKSIFLRAIEIPSAEQRAAFLASACGTDRELRGQVEALLGAHEQSLGLLDAPGLAVPTTALPPPEGSGTGFGPYKLLQGIGEGGMGAVWMAQQTEPVRRLVALKVIKPGMDSAQVIARFEAERQALALMDHPHIAKVFDAGATPEGRPYFVMELVKGVPITRFCDERHLTPRERLELFVPVCQAVQHAHQKGVIHRDLKPSNVLVAVYDGQPVPKIIDFGVAKAVGQPLTERTLVTGFGAVVGTLEYMSPEQAQLNQLDIDTRSDIYSLGVLLYELLTGTTPLRRERVRGAALLEVLRRIREEEPARPSTTAELPGIAANRGLEPKRLSGLVRGELDWIVMKCLEKDPSRRYETASGLARDVQRYLADEPVQACPPSTWYRLRKTVRRHKGPFLAAALVLAALLVGVVGTTVGWLRARAAEQLAGERLAQVQRANVQTTQALGESEKARKEADDARRRTREALYTLTDEALKPLLAKQVELGAREKAFLRKAQKLFEEFARSQGDTEQARRDRADGAFRVARVRRPLGELKEAEKALRDALAVRRQLAADFPPVPEYRDDLAATYFDLGLVLLPMGRIPDAEAAYREALALRRKLAADFPAVANYRHGLAATHGNLGALLAEAGRPGEAEAAYREALAQQQQLLAESPKDPESHLALAMTHGNLGDLLYATGRPQAAEPFLRQAVAHMEKLCTAFPSVPEYAHAGARNYNSLGRLLWTMGRSKEAETAYRKALGVQRKLAARYPTVPAYRRELAITLTNLGPLFASTARSDDAEAAYREALILHHRLADDFPRVPSYRRELAVSLSNLGSLLAKTNRPQKAEVAFRHALAIEEKLVAESPGVPEYEHALASRLLCLANLRGAAGDHAGARELLERARPHHRAALKANPRHPEYRLLFRNHLWFLCEALGGLGDHAAAAATADELAGFAYEPLKDIYSAACFAAHCVPLARRDGKLPEARRQELARAYTDQAVRLLTQAVARGFRDEEKLKRDTCWAPLRDRADFQKLLKEVGAKASPQQERD